MYTLVLNGPSFPMATAPAPVSRDTIMHEYVGLAPAAFEQPWTILGVRLLRSLRPEDETLTQLMTFIEAQAAVLGLSDTTQVYISMPVRYGQALFPYNLQEHRWSDALCEAEIPQVTSSGDFNKLTADEAEELKRLFGFVPVLLSPALCNMAAKSPIRHKPLLWLLLGNASGEETQPSHIVSAAHSTAISWAVVAADACDPPVLSVYQPPADALGINMQTRTAPLTVDPGQELRDAIFKNTGSSEFAEAAREAFRTRTLDPIRNLCERKGDVPC